jgi:3-hydroxyacyl-CoA dehydrogenase/enoyl-CoA hydratase/3-hydroxybutyryl-CoA epimerase
MGAFRIERDNGGVVRLVFDHPDRRVNVIDEAALAGLERSLDELEKLDGVTGLLLVSGKPGSFIAGADVDAIASITEREVALALIRRAHAAFTRLSEFKTPTVAVIDGPCLGGGTELALCCDSRVASEEPRTQIGLPEVLLGIYPGFGGSVRLPRLIGLIAALDLILTGRALDGRRAEKMGLVARSAPAAWLMDRARERLDALVRRKDRRRRDRYRPATAVDAWLQGPFGRPLVFSQARGQTKARTAGHYPAPLAAIDVLEHTIGRPIREALEIEASRVADLLTGPVCKDLVRIFQLSEEAKKARVVEDVTIQPAPIDDLALIGAGVMGGGIAELATRQGMRVRMRDVRPESLTKALATVDGLIAERAKRRRMAPRDRDEQWSRLSPTLELTGLTRADAAIEAVVEDLDVKRRVFGELEVRLAPEALLATNTSSLSVNELAGGLAHPERFCGFHFFNPVHRMPLVEVVRGARTSDAALVRAVALARRLGKTPVVVKDSPGFVVNRVLMPYLREAMALLEEGFRLPDIDGAMRRFGMPMGPFEVVDEVGIDVAHKVAGVLSAAFPQRMTPAPALEKLLAAGRLGRKSGRGFYRHRGRKREPDPEVRSLLGLHRERPAPNTELLADRMVFAMVNESARCLEEGVVGDAGKVDLALIFGAGFPPFRGGPLRHADRVGLAKIHQRLMALQAEKGPRFEPSALLARLATEGGSFTQPVA